MADNLSTTLADDAKAHTINLLRIEAGMRMEVVGMLETLEKDLIKQVSATDLTTAKKERLQAFLDQTTAQVSSAYKQINDVGAANLEKVATISSKQVAKSLNAGLGVDIGTVLSPQQLTAIAKGPIVEGSLMADWWAGQDMAAQRRFKGAIQQGLLLGEDMASIQRRIRGSKASGFTDGALSVSKREAAALTRTAVQSVNNQARIDTLMENGDVVKGIEWVATLDARTTKTCFSGATRVAPIGRIIKIFRRAYQGDLILIRAADCKQITVTPNHPVLTARGWRRAEELKPSDKIAKAFHAGLVEVCQDVEMHPTFAAIADALFHPSVSEIRSEGAAPADFHGDGMRGDEQVEIAIPYLELRDGFNPHPSESIEHQTLVWLHETGCLAAGTGFADLLFSGTPPVETPPINAVLFQSGVEPRFADSKGTKNFGGPFASLEPFDSGEQSLASDASGEVFHNPHGFQETGGGGGAKAPGDFRSRDTGAIEFADIVCVGREFGSLHVFNFETTQGVYSAEGLLVKNCMALDGKQWRLPDLKPIGHDKVFPGAVAHWNCVREGQEADTHGQQILRGYSRNYVGTFVTIKTARGHELTVTPNHPILTTQGFVPAGDLSEGGDVISDFIPCETAVSGTGELHTKQGKSLIEEITGALQKTSGFSTESIIIRGIDFHGDGQDGEVAIVSTDRRLLDENQSPVAQHAMDSSFLGTDEIDPRSSIGGVFTTNGFGVYKTSIGCAEPFSLGRIGSVFPTVLHGFGFIPYGMTRFPNPKIERMSLASDIGENCQPIFTGDVASNSAIADGLGIPGAPARLDASRMKALPNAMLSQAELAHNILNGNLGEIQVDQIISVVLWQGEGRVHNLETTLNFYSAQGMVTGNCRSTQGPVTYSWAELAGKKLKAKEGRPTFEEAFQKRLEQQGFTPEEAATIKANQRASMDGQVSDSKSWEEWMKGKGDQFALDQLGPGRFALWKQGKLTLTDLTDQQGRELTLAELEAAIDGGTIPPETEGRNFNPANKAAIYTSAQEDAAEEQAAESKASVLSAAKKKLVGGGEPTPAQQKLIDSLTPQEKLNFYEAVADAIYRASG